MLFSFASFIQHYLYDLLIWFVMCMVYSCDECKIFYCWAILWLFVHSLIKGHLSFFRSGSIMNMTINFLSLITWYITLCWSNLSNARKNFQRHNIAHWVANQKNLHQTTEWTFLASWHKMVINIPQTPVKFIAMKDPCQLEPDLGICLYKD